MGSHLLSICLSSWNIRLCEPNSCPSWSLSIPCGRDILFDIQCIGGHPNQHLRIWAVLVSWFSFPYKPPALPWRLYDLCISIWHIWYRIHYQLYKLEKVLDLSTHTMEFCHPSMPAWFSGPCSISIMSAIFGRTCKRAFFPTTVILTKAGIRASWVITANSSFRASIRWARY